jgi:phage-related baseplate assembly protein
MPKSKNVNIKYTSREFDSIKQDLVDHAKRFYPENYKDFTMPSFGSMVLDSVSYVGDILSYYVDYAVNESFLDTSVEFNNIRRHARALGYRFKGTPSSFGTIAFFVLCPANSEGTAPDLTYLPTIKRGAALSSDAGGNYVLTEDVVFNDPKTQFVAARFNSSTGATTYFACKAFGQIQSGIFVATEVDLTNQVFQRFRKIRIGETTVSEVISVSDSDGNRYYEVDNLSQEVIFVETTNNDAIADGVRSIMKPFVTTRKFVVYQDDTGTYLQFGFGSQDDDSSAIIDPSKVALKMHGKNTISDLSFDPTKLISTNKLGISPYNTKLRVTMRLNEAGKTAAASNSIKTISDKTIEFEDLTSLTTAQVNVVESSLECINEDPIGAASTDITNEELKQRAKAYYAAQNRAVTKQDYEALVYQMPTKFGAVKRANIVNDPSSTNRMISLYVISEDNNGYLASTSQIIKNNIKNYLSHYIPINDSVMIKDSIVVNFGIEFLVMNDRNYDADSVLFKCQQKLTEYFAETLYIGEPLYLTLIYELLNDVEGVYDVKRVKAFNKNGGSYSSTNFNFDNALSKDGTYIKVPKNVILELKFPNSDIKGTVK